MKQDENIREVEEDGEIRLFVKKYDMWWPASKNKEGEVFPDLRGEEGYKSTHDNLKKMLTSLEKSGTKEIDFSHWSFSDLNFDEEILPLMKFADKIDFSGAEFLRISFDSGQLENADFLGAEISSVCFTDIDIRDCIFDKTNLGETYFTRINAHNCNFDQPRFSENDIIRSTFTACRFKDVQLDEIKSVGNTFIKCKYINTDKEKLTSKPSVLGKLNSFKDKLASMQNKNQDIAQKQHQHTDVQR